jgi:hypothetical protein
MNDEKIDRYLFDPSAPPADEVQHLEELLAAHRFDPEANPPRIVQWRRRLVPLFAAAAVLLLITGAALWLWTWPSQRPWTVVSGSMPTFPVGSTVTTSDALRVRVAHIGWMQVSEGSVVTLRSTRTNRHRLAVTAGTIHVSVWAPPASIAVSTPEGEVIDLGCEFVLDVHGQVTRLDVISGWVELDNGFAEVLVPAGATSEMSASGYPAVPVFKSADPAFRAAVRELEHGSPGAVETVVAKARRGDVLTLLLLAQRGMERERLLQRAAELMPPQSPQTIERARRGESMAISEWIGELPLPPTKSWLRNWRDLFGLR